MTAGIRRPSRRCGGAVKSTLQDYAHWLAAEQMKVVVERLLEAASSPEWTPEEGGPLRLAKPIELDRVWLDSTCVKAAIHYPVDWVLLRDGTRTLMKATGMIRKHGLKRRMEEPAVFLKRMNSLLLVEQAQGSIVDWAFEGKEAGADTEQLGGVGF